MDPLVALAPGRAVVAGEAVEDDPLGAVVAVASGAEAGAVEVGVEASGTVVGVVDATLAGKPGGVPVLPPPG